MKEIKIIADLTKKGHQAAFQLKKHAPLILTVGAGVGLMGTGILAYRSRDRVIAALDDIDTRREAGEAISNQQAMTKVATELAPPILLGAASIACLAGAYYIQNDRLKAVSAALAMAINEHRRYRSRAREVLDEETFKKVDTPADYETKKIGKEKVEVTIPREGDLFGKWFVESTEYLKDDPDYNEAWIREVERKAIDKLKTTGTLMYADLMSMFGFTHAKQSLPFGWTDSDSFYIEYVENQAYNEETDEIQVLHYVSWATPRNLYAPTRL